MSDRSANANKTLRVRKLSKPRMQLRLTLTFVSLAVFASLSTVILVESVMSQALADAGVDAQNIDTLGSILRAMIGTLLVLVPVMTAVGIVVTNRIAGPVYRLETHLAEIARGAHPEPCRLRKGDELQDLCEVMNEAVDTLRSEAADARSDGAQQAA